MRTPIHATLFTALLLAAAMIFAACGDDENGGANGNGDANGNGGDEQQRGSGEYIPTDPADDPFRHGEQEPGLYVIVADTCPFTGNDILANARGVHNGWEVIFCSFECRATFLDDPESHAERIRAHTGYDIRVELHAVGNEQCPDREGSAVDGFRGVYNGWVVEFSNPAGVDRFNDNPEAYFERIEELTGTDIQVAPSAATE